LPRSVATRSGKLRGKLRGVKLDLYRYPQYEIYRSANYSPTFGGGHDLYLSKGMGQT